MKRKAEDAEEAEWSDGSKWKRGRLIGKGEFGSVFLATLKKPKSKFSCFPTVMAVKSAEVSVSGSLQKEKQVLDNVKGCSNVIKCFGEEVTTSDKGEMIYNMLLEFASGGTLADHIKNCGRPGLPETHVKRYTRAILKGLIHIHDCGYVHCDLKPDNILLVPNPNLCACGNYVVKIGDFGLAKRKTTSKKRKVDPYLRGTAMYMAPETILHNIQEPPSDIWALGCVVLEMLTGKSPWQKNPNLNTDDLLRLISDEKELPDIPTRISEGAKEFLKACFVRKTMYRFTAEMLLYHEFLAGLNDDHRHMNTNELTGFPRIGHYDDEEDYDDDGEDSDELYYSSGSDDWYYTDEDDISSCFDSEGFEEIVSSINGNPAEEIKLESPKKEMPSNCVGSCNGDNSLGPLSLASTIPTGL